ncbi:MAG: Rieske 2Fe-2S domain-containing protein [Mycobacterium sp.]|nr:Rieske 2Fe-2S domain-containing protein [Mycobacterium sp.]
MLSVAENELICRTGPGTPMGNLMREYWVPAMLSSEVPTPDSNPVRVLLLGEKLIGFRDTQGQVGLIQNHCPHRGASLFFGRNEEAGLRCVYHGWKFAIDGTCVDMPNEPAESDFKHKVKAVAYPCEERGGIVWTYMGPRSTPPPLPDIEGNMVEGATATAVQHECNWLQVGEGAIDTSHAGFLHFGSLKAEDYPDGTFSRYLLVNRSPKYAVVNTDIGVTYGAYRPVDERRNFWRIANFLLPFYTMNPQGLLGSGPQGWQARVPMDDTHMISFGFAGPRRQRPASAASGGQRGQTRQLLDNTTDWYGRFRQISNLENDFFIDRDLQRSNSGPDGWTGVQGVGRQDQTMTTSMGPIYDRSKEHLGSSDAMVIQVRRRLLSVVKAHAESGVTPPGVDNPSLYRLRSGSVMLEQDVEDWFEATRELRTAFVQHADLDYSLLGGGLSG